MTPYFSRTGTKRNLDFLRVAGWAILISATGVWRTEGFDQYAVDNGAWTAHQQKHPFDAGKFEGVLSEFGTGAEFVVVPDIVAGGLDSLRFTEQWLPRLDSVKRRLIAVQDGMSPDDVRPLLGGDVGVAVGGSTEFKLQTLPAWAHLAKEKQVYLHVLRVNTGRRIAYCRDVGADSFDGSGASRWLKWARHLDACHRQQGLFA